MDVSKEALWPCMERWPVRQRYLVGVSGGLDSVVLLRSLQEAGYGKLTVCHLDHGLRGRASAADARWVMKLAAELGLAFVTSRVDLRAEATIGGVSLETAGRLARHRFFAETARRLRCYRVFLAHHADDQAETALMNLCRGSAGLKAMVPEAPMAVAGFRKPIILLRPFLGLSKATLQDVAVARGWTCREDASNAVPDVVRNRLRIEVLPLLAAIFQRDPAPAMARAIAWTEGARDFIQQAAAPWISQEKLPSRVIAALPAVLRDTVLAGWLRAQGVPDISTPLLQKVVTMLDPATGPARWNLPGNAFLRRRAGCLWVERVPACGGGGG